jgi:hypothetical protein
MNMNMDMDIPSEYICPITQDIMKDPVFDNEGNTYDKQAVMKWLARNRTSPVSRKPLRIADLRPNIALKNLISSFNEKNKEAMETHTMREARLKRFENPSEPEAEPEVVQPAPTPAPPSDTDSNIRDPDPIIQETLISDDPYPEEEGVVLGTPSHTMPNEMSDEEMHRFMFGDMVFSTPSYTIPESITTFGGRVIQITHSTVDIHKYLCKNYCCVNIPMPSTGYCKKCRDMSRMGIDISKSWNPKHPAFKNQKGHIKNYLKSRCPREVDQAFELETRDKFKCARYVIKDIRTHHLKNTRISDYPVSIDDEDILPYLQRFFN